MEEKEREELSYLVDVGLKVSIFGMVITIFVDYISKMPFGALLVDFTWLLSTIIAFILNKTGKNPVALMPVFLPMYVILITFMMFYTGGLEGTSHFMFFILICFSAVALGLRFGILIATLSFGTFSLATWFEYFDLVRYIHFQAFLFPRDFLLIK